MRPGERKNIARCFVWGVESRVNVNAYSSPWYEGFPVAKSFGQRHLVFLFGHVGIDNIMQ